VPHSAQAGAGAACGHRRDQCGLCDGREGCLGGAGCAAYGE
jgi:hypothetical protein